MRCQQNYRDMALNNAVRELTAYKDQQRIIQALKEKAAEAREKYISIQAVKYDSIKVTGGALHDRMCEIIIKWAEMETDISNKELDAEHTYWNIKRKLSQLTAAQSKVLELYYLKLYSIAKVASTMEYSDEWVKTTKHTALKNYSRL